MVDLLAKFVDGTLSNISDWDIIFNESLGVVIVISVPICLRMLLAITVFPWWAQDDFITSIARILDTGSRLLLETSKVRNLKQSGTKRHDIEELNSLIAEMESSRARARSAMLWSFLEARWGFHGRGDCPSLSLLRAYLC